MSSPKWLLATLLVAGLGVEARADHVDWGPFLEKPGDTVKVFNSKPDKPAPAPVADAPAKKAKTAKVAKAPKKAAAAPKAKSARKAKR